MRKLIDILKEIKIQQPNRKISLNRVKQLVILELQEYPWAEQPDFSEIYEAENIRDLIDTLSMYGFNQPAVDLLEMIIDE